MKLVFVLFALLVASASAGGKGGQMMQIVKQCADESNVQITEIAAAMKGSGAISEKVGCVVGCIGGKLGLLNADGSINEAALQAMQSGKMKKLAEMILKCKASAKGSNKCQIGQALLQCIKKGGLPTGGVGDGDD